MSVLDIGVVPTYNMNLLAIADGSVYDAMPVSPTVEITPASFAKVTLTFTPSQLNVYNSTDLGLTTGTDFSPIPDGIYTITYSIAPAYENYVTKTLLRVDQLQEKFDAAFLTLDMMECDRAIKTQQKVELSTAYFLIQGAMAAANNCATVEAMKLYSQASKMLDYYTSRNCGCSGNNYVVNFS